MRSLHSASVAGLATAFAAHVVPGNVAGYLNYVPGSGH